MIESSDPQMTRIAPNHGAGHMPALGFGTLIPEAAVTITASRDALQAGFRHFHCAERYGNEREVGRALQAGLAAPPRGPLLASLADHFQTGNPEIGVLAASHFFLFLLFAFLAHLCAGDGHFMPDVSGETDGFAAKTAALTVFGGNRVLAWLITFLQAGVTETALPLVVFSCVAPTSEPKPKARTNARM
jgi:hypothetical protein